MSGTSLSSANLSPQKKKILIRAWHRGTREMDLLIGHFADRHLPDFTDAECDAFEAMIAALDGDMLDWVTGAAPLPESENTPMMQRFLAESRQHKA